MAIKKVLTLHSNNFRKAPEKTDDESWLYEEKCRCVLFRSATPYNQRLDSPLKRRRSK